MDFLGSLLEGAAHEVFGDDANEVIDTVGSFFGGSDDGGSEGGGSSWARTLGSFFGGSDAGGSEGGDGGWASTIGGYIDRFSGDGGRDSLVHGIVDRVGSYLPEDIRGAAGRIFSGDSSSWAGNLVNYASTAMPAGWQSVGNAALGHGYGEA